jgi:hypothetical protein
MNWKRFWSAPVPEGPCRECEGKVELGPRYCPACLGQGTELARVFLLMNERRAVAQHRALSRAGHFAGTLDDWRRVGFFRRQWLLFKLPTLPEYDHDWRGL